MPPGPVRVSSRVCSSSALASAISCSRPTNRSCTGRLRVWRPVSSAAEVGREALDHQLVQVHGQGDVLQPVLAEVAEEAPSGRACSTSPLVASETRTCPPWPAAAIRAARFTSMPT